jgi:hypothetical protein
VKRVEYNCVAMSHLQDLRKVASGLAMVVKESMKMAPRFPPENVGGSAFEILKAVTGTVTDLTGLTQGRVKELQNRELGRPREGEDGGVGRAGGRAGSNVSTSAAASGRESYLLNSLDSLGPPRSRVTSASDRTDEVVSRVKEEILPSVAETPMSKPLQKFAPVDSDCSDKPSPSRVLDRKDESKLDSEAIKAEQVLQASQKGGAFILLQQFISDLPNAHGIICMLLFFCFALTSLCLSLHLT